MDAHSKECDRGGEQMSCIVGGRERKTVSVMSSHFPLHIHVFSLQKASNRKNTGVRGKQTLSSSNTSCYKIL